MRHIPYPRAIITPVLMIIAPETILLAHRHAIPFQLFRQPFFRVSSALVGVWVGGGRVGEGEGGDVGC